MSIFTNLILIALGGALGACSRYLIALGAQRVFPVGFPAGTLIANVSGCFMMGFLMGYGASHHQSNRIYLTFAVGFLGSLTTFSAFSGETLGYALDREYKTAVWNVLCNVLMSLLAVTFGFWLGKTTTNS